MNPDHRSSDRSPSVALAPSDAAAWTDPTGEHAGCAHEPRCPAASAADHDAARVVSRHPEQGWSLLCNGVVLFEDTGELLPDGSTVAPHRPACRVWSPCGSPTAA